MILNVEMIEHCVLVLAHPVIVSAELALSVIRNIHYNNYSVQNE